MTYNMLNGKLNPIHSPPPALHGIHAHTAACPAVSSLVVIVALLALVVFVTTVFDARDPKHLCFGTFDVTFALIQ